MICLYTKATLMPMGEALLDGNDDAAMTGRGDDVDPADAVPATTK
jgi:hypothetical protein